MCLVALFRAVRGNYMEERKCPLSNKNVRIATITIRGVPRVLGPFPDVLVRISLHWGEINNALQVN